MGDAVEQALQKVIESLNDVCTPDGDLLELGAVEGCGSGILDFPPTTGIRQALSVFCFSHSPLRHPRKNS